MNNSKYLSHSYLFYNWWPLFSGFIQTVGKQVSTFLVSGLLCTLKNYRDHTVLVFHGLAIKKLIKKFLRAPKCLYLCGLLIFPYYKLKPRNFRNFNIFTNAFLNESNLLEFNLYLWKNTIFSKKNRRMAWFLIFANLLNVWRNRRQLNYICFWILQNVV